MMTTHLLMLLGLLAGEPAAKIDAPLLDSNAAPELAQAGIQGDTDGSAEDRGDEGHDASEDQAEEDEENYKQLVQEAFQTELVYPQEKGEFQITGSASYQDAEDSELFSVPVLFEYGLTNAWQIEIELDAFQRLETADGAISRGIGDAELGTKYSFMNIGGSSFHAAAGLDLTFPLGDEDEGLSEGLFEFEPYVALGKDLPGLNNAHLFAQVGLGLVHRARDEDAPEQSEEASDESKEPAAHELTLSSGFLVPVGSLRLVTELNWSTNQWNNGGDEASLFVTPGVVWDLPGTWEASFGVPIGLTDDADRFRLLGALTWEFGGDGS